MDHLLLHQSIGALRTRVEDLQAEIEAGARCAERIDEKATAMDERFAAHLWQTAELMALRRTIDELRTSIVQQRTILRDLRQSMSDVRLALR